MSFDIDEVVVRPMRPEEFEEMLRGCNLFASIARSPLSRVIGVGQRYQQLVVAIVALPPRLVELSKQRRFGRIFGVAAGLLHADAVWRGRLGASLRRSGGSECKYEEEKQSAHHGSEPIRSGWAGLSPP